MNPDVDFYFNKASQWRKEYRELRMILLDCDLVEELKWGVPCYTYQKKNIVLIHGFKEYCAILFHKGVLLDDPENLLIQQTKNVQSARQMRFTSIEEIIRRENSIRQLVHEAVEVEKSGQKVPYKKPAQFAVAEEFQTKLDENPAIEQAFKALTPGRQRAYLLHFSSAKRSATRESRVEKYIPKILEGKGMDD